MSSLCFPPYSALQGMSSKVVVRVAEALARVFCSAAVCFLRLSFDEGRQWNKYSFTNTPLFVDGVLGEPGEETLIMT